MKYREPFQKGNTILENTIKIYIYLFTKLKCHRKVQKISSLSSLWTRIDDCVLSTSRFKCIFYPHSKVTDFNCDKKAAMLHIFPLKKSVIVGNNSVHTYT
jgi:hypothetical protein